MSTQLMTVQEAGAVLDKQRHEGEQELALHEEHLQNSRSRLNELKTKMEDQTHLVDIELARKKKDALEDAMLSMLDQVERNEQETQELQSQMGEIEQHFAHAKEQGEAESTALEQERSILEERHGALTKRMGPALLASYTKLKSLRTGLVIAKVEDGTRLGCRLQLPPQLVAEVRRADELLHCLYCHRILYWEPAT